MKKSIAIVLAVLSILTVLASCNRRDQYRDPVGTETNAETATPTTNAVTDQPDNPDETTGQDTESGTTPVNPGNSPSPEGTGNPYAGMSKDDLLALYQQTSERTMFSCDAMFNTPYYFIMNRGTGGQAYSKLTGNVITLCKQLGCNHLDDNCVFKGTIQECVIIGDRIYLGIQNGFADRFRLYSFNLMLDDAELIYEWNDLDDPTGFGAFNGKIYLAAKVLSDDNTVKGSMFVIDPVQKTCDFALGEEFVFQVGRGMIENCFYYTATDGALWQYDMQSNVHTCLLEASLLNPENGDIRFWALEIAGPNHIRVIRQNAQLNKYLCYDLHTGEIITEESIIGEDKVYLMWNNAGQYLLTKHNTASYVNDPHYTYYNDMIENWLVNYSGGQLWYRQDSDDELSLLVYMQTDGIPDAIRDVIATDGKTLVVYYNTYKDFDNIYNNYNKETRGDNPIRFAIIDLQTGTVYKNNYIAS
ncbi:MAG: hypothetical protein IJ363_10630 [Clostridia bacterium]|nr:hypothetical protein [Clostridia bacterium]